MPNSFMQNTHFVPGIDPVADAFSGTVRTDVVNMNDYSAVTFILYHGVGTTGTSTLTVEACDDVSASSTTAIPFRYKVMTSSDTQGALTAATTSGFTTTAGSSDIYVIEADAEEIAGTGYQYVRLNAVESANDPVLGGVLILLHGARYAQDVPATAIV